MTDNDGMNIKGLGSALVWCGAGQETEGPDVTNPRLVKRMRGQANVRVAAGGSHSLMLTSTGRVSSAGHNVFGQLGDRPPQPPSPAQLPSLGLLVSHPWNARSAIAHHTSLSVVLTVERLSSGVLAYTSPAPSVVHRGSGIAGHGDSQNRDKPAEIEALWPLGVIQIACGDNHSAALTADGRVFTWGRGKYGQLGLGSFETSSTPQHVKLPVDIVQASRLCLFLGKA